MNKWIIILLLISYNNRAQSNLDIINLKKGFTNKEKKVFLKNFPNNFKDFKSVFGWNDKLDKPNVLYDEAKDYIDYFFKLSSKSNLSEDIIIKIASQAKWEEDSVNYFHMNLVNLVENDIRFMKLLEKYNDKDLNAFWYFYFDLEDLIYSSKLYNILDNSMRNKSMFVFNSLKEERRKSNNDHRKVYVYQIFDIDGYSNLRKESNTKSDIIEKLKTNEIVEVLDNSDDWWFILSKNNNIGFIHKSRVKVKK